jgi:hypothetical protein
VCDRARKPQTKAKNPNIHESKRRERSRPSSPKEQLYVVKIGLQRPSLTACAIALIHIGYSDPYEPGTKRERAYMAGILSIYQDDCITDVALLLAIQ